MKYEWYPFNPSRYRADTMHLTAEQDGIYRRLIDHYMETELPLPDNDLALARIAGVDESCFKQHSSTIKAFFKQENGKLRHKKCDLNLEEMNLRYKKLKDRAQKGGIAKAQKAIETKEVSASSMLQADTKQCLTLPPYPTLPNLTVKKKEKRASNFDEFWNLCPRKVGKGDAERKYLKALEEISHENLCKKMKLHKAQMQGSDVKYIPHPATWLFQKRYFDDTPEMTVELKDDWPKWKNALAARIGEHNVKSLFSGAEMNGEVFYVSKKFQADKIRSEFMIDISTVFGKDYRIEVKPN